VSAVVAFAALGGGLGGAGVALLAGSLPKGALRALGPRLVRVLVGRAQVAPAAPGDLQARIDAAGCPAGLGARELMALKLAAATLAGVVSLALTLAAPGRMALVLLALGPVAGFLAPELWLARHAAERARRIRRELPPLLDLLRVSIESGSSLPESLRGVGSRTHGPLASEWRAVGRQVAVGVPLERALVGMTARAPLPEVRALAAALDRARRHGAPLGETLAAQARDARFALARHAREEAARAGPKIQLVVALLLVPSVLLLVAAALLAALVGGGELVPVSS
jgi:tight adherence protein C